MKCSRDQSELLDMEEMPLFEKHSMDSKKHLLVEENKPLLQRRDKIFLINFRNRSQRHDAFDRFSGLSAP